MITSRLSGGLGNQMFQYATGLALSLRKKTDFAVDTSSFSSPNSNTVSRRFVLDNFHITARVVENKGNFLSKIKNNIVKKLDSRKSFSQRKIIVESKFTFIPEIFESGPDCELIGVWQSEKYFLDYENIVRQEFKLRTPLSIQANEIYSKINKSNSVSIHIRRGDYVEKSNTYQKHGVCSAEYYSLSIKLITSKLNNCEFYVFSDDIKWAEKNIHTPTTAIFVSSLGFKDYEELTLMSACKHNITANSSFSWWGAWLNGNPEKIVVAPKNWFKSESISDHDLVPTKWIRL